MHQRKVKVEESYGPVVSLAGEQTRSSQQKVTKKRTGGRKPIPAVRTRCLFVVVALARILAPLHATDHGDLENQVPSRPRRSRRRTGPPSWHRPR